MTVYVYTGSLFYVRKESKPCRLYAPVSGTVEEDVGLHILKVR